MKTLLTVALFLSCGPIFRTLFSGLLGGIQSIAKRPFLGRSVPAVCNPSLAMIPLLEAVAEGGLLGLLLGMGLEAWFPYSWLTKIAVFSVLYPLGPLYLSQAVGRFFPHADVDQARDALLSDPTLGMVHLRPRIYGNLETSFNLGFLIMYSVYVWGGFPTHPAYWATALAGVDLTLWTSFWWILTKQGSRLPSI